jgi:hypothetical protein
LEKGLKSSIRVLERKKNPNKYNTSFAKLEIGFESSNTVFKK